MKFNLALLNQWIFAMAAVTTGYFAVRSYTPFISIGLGVSSLLFVIAAIRVHRKRKALDGSP